MATLRKAERKQARIRIGLSGPSGSGKSIGALKIAHGMTGDWSKIAVIDTENGSGDLYSHLGDYNIMTLVAPFTPESFIEAIRECEKADMEVIIIDSTTHEWDGEGGCLQINDALAKSKFGWNTWSAWSMTGARHQKFIDKILLSPCHVITTVRNKTETAQVEEGGKKKIVKLGTKEIQRDGFEYELTMNFNISREWHYATASKDRTGLFIDRDPFVISEDTGKEITDWNASGKKLPTPAEEFERFDIDLKSCADFETLKTVFTEVHKNKEFLGESYYNALTSLKDDMKNSIESREETKAPTAKSKLTEKVAEEEAEAMKSEEFKEIFGDEVIVTK